MTALVYFALGVAAGPLFVAAGLFVFNAVQTHRESRAALHRAANSNSVVREFRNRGQQ